MTTLREAAQQALEYLDAPSAKLWPAGTQHRIIAALRAALAEPVQEPVAWVYASIAGSVALHIVKPVGVAKASFVQSKLDNDMQVAKEYPNAHSCAPLYTAPPQRKPLTEEEIAALLSQSAGVNIKLNGGDLLFTRAIERAHGIGGQDEP